MGKFHKTVPQVDKARNLFCQFLIIYFTILISIQPTWTQTSDTPDYCYNDPSCGPSTWAGLCKTGRKQSPINIVTSGVNIQLKSSRLVLNRNYAQSKNFFLQNNGRTVRLSLRPDLTSKCYLRGDGLSKKAYYFSQLHFHWGRNIGEGSEHRISGQKFPLEMHMVHQQLQNPQKTAVVAVLFYISPRNNPNLNPIIRNLRRVVQPSEEPVQMPAGAKVMLTSLLPKRMRMFRYVGSLTTPPCTQNVLWTVFLDRLPISKRQLAQFRKLRNGSGAPIRWNFRPTQPLYGRRVNFLRMLKTRQRGRVG